MGADFLLAACKLPVDQDNDPIDDWSKIESLVYLRVQELQRESPEVLSSAMFDLAGGDEVTPAQEIEMAMTALREVVEGQDRRDVCTAKFDSDRWWLVTGGMSWGDSPTDMCQSIWFTINTSIFDEPFSI